MRCVTIYRDTAHRRKEPHDCKLSPIQSPTVAAIVVATGRTPTLEVWFMTGERPGRRGHRRSRRGMHGPAGFGGPLGPGRRAGRGDMRAAILALLAEEPMHGYQIIQVISERSGGNWTPSPGSVYPTLQQLEDEGLIEPAASESGRRVSR